MHWTYQAKVREADLEQGDILSPTDDLKRLLRGIHPHFDSTKYLAFIVTSQSCDLVRRDGGAPKAAYISIATVRPLENVIMKLLAAALRPVAKDVFRIGAKYQAKQLIERLVDQNEQALGLFYLHPDADIGLGTSAVAFLRVSVSLRADHYGVLVHARTGSLNPEFRAKFGWLLGNLYSRAATRDWADMDGGKKEIEKLTQSLLNAPSEAGGPVWVDDELVDAVRAAKINLLSFSKEEVLAILDQHRSPPRIERAANAALDVIDRVIPLSMEQRREIRNRLVKDDLLRKLLK